MKLLKRIFDLVLSGFGIVFLSPLFVAIAILIYKEDKGPSFFRQRRVGQYGKFFSMIKFRTMTNNPPYMPNYCFVTYNNHRITKIGYWLRYFKLDELPQLFNVFQGQMSFVGPRPEIPYYVSHYTSQEKKVLDFLPGITDLASVQFRHEERLIQSESNPEKLYIDQIMPEKLRLSIEYAESATITSDIDIIIFTIRKIFD
jgi:lipopolysaccharide/colanic/teichoic acid biosynthesis glycosyltransferase